MKLMAIPTFSLSARLVVERNFYHFLKNWITSILSLVLAPILYLIMFGIGLGAYVGKIDDMPYIAYLFPGLTLGTAAVIAFMETAYGSRRRIWERQVFENYRRTPMHYGDVAKGEIMWSTLKASLVGWIMLSLGWVLQIAPDMSYVIVSAFLVLLTGLLFAAVGLFVLAYSPDSSLVSIVHLFLIVPLLLISEVYFPVQTLGPQWEWLKWTSPLYYLVEGLRSLSAQGVTSFLCMGLAIFWICGMVFTNLAGYLLTHRPHFRVQM